jgi:hypothetical protein
MINNFRRRIKNFFNVDFILTLRGIYNVKKDEVFTNLSKNLSKFEELIDSLSSSGAIYFYRLRLGIAVDNFWSRFLF